MLEKEFVFLNHFFEVANSFDHNDLKDAIMVPHRYRAHFETQLSTPLEMRLNEQNFSFILGLACLLRGWLFQKIPAIISLLDSNQKAALIRDEVFKTFFSHSIAKQLSRTYRQISPDTATLIEHITRWPIQLKDDTVEACFDLLSLSIIQKEEDWK